MHFAFTEDQLALRDAVKELLDKECTPARVRAQDTAGIWPLLADHGVLGMTLPEAAGGLGLGPAEWVLILVEAGYHALPLPLADTLALQPLLLQAGLDDVAQQVAAGTVTVSLGVPGAAVHRADRVFFVEDGRVSEVRDPSFERIKRLSRDVFRVRGTHVPVDGDGRALLDRQHLAVAAELLGIARRQLDLAVHYAKERKQFGKPIGAFQAIQHQLADALMAVTFAAPCVYRAAADPSTMHTSAALSMAVEASREVRKIALQVHGAIGYTDEYDLQLWLKRGLALEHAWGSARSHRVQVARHLFGESHA